MNKLITLACLHLLAIPSVFFTSNSVNAQTSPSPELGTELGNFFSQNNEAQTSQPSGTFFAPNNGSQQFFQQGREQLYFLPTKKSTPILQIDDELREKKPKASPQEPSETEKSPEKPEIHDLSEQG
jgi:hypothetical protein